MVYFSSKDDKIPTISWREEEFPFIRVSYQGENFVVTSRGKKEICGIISLEGRIMRMFSTLEEKIKFHVAADETELRLVFLMPYYWVLANEVTGQGYVADTIFPNCLVDIELPLRR
jgi:hypothetical protein